MQPRNIIHHGIISLVRGPHVSPPLDTVISLFFLPEGGRVGDPEVGAGQVFEQVGGDLQRREQTQTFHSDGPDRRSSGDFSGEIRLY